MLIDSPPLERLIREEVRLMIILERDGSLQHEQLDRCATTVRANAQAVFEIPAALALRSDTLIERLLEYAFDLLGLRAVELRVREE